MGWLVTLGARYSTVLKGPLKRRREAGREEIEGLGQRGMRARRGMEGKDE